MRYAIVLVSFLAACSAPSASPSPSPSTSPDAAAADAGALDSGPALASVITIEDAPMVVLAETTSPEWGIGLAWSVGERDPYESSLLAMRHVSTSALPAEVRASAAYRWELIGETTRCRVHLGEPVLVRRCDGDMFGGETDETESPPFADLESPEARMWSSGLEVLAAPIVVDEGDCTGARVAIPVQRPMDHVFRGVETLDDATREQARAAFVDLTAYQALQVEYESYLRSDGAEWNGARWPAYGGEDSTMVTMLRDHAGRELVEIIAHGEEGCGGFPGSLFVLFERTEGGLVVIDSGPADAAPDMILDASDGTRTYVGYERWRHPSDADESGWPVWHDVRSPWLGCNC